MSDDFSVSASIDTEPSSSLPSAKLSSSASTSGEHHATVQLLIRKIIFDKFNNTDLRFTNDEIFDIIKTDHGNLLPDDICDVCDVESDFDSLCKSGLVRNIAQNFNTMWLKLFDVIEELPKCVACSNVTHLGRSEERKCPNPVCGMTIA